MNSRSLFFILFGNSCDSRAQNSSPTGYVEFPFGSALPLRVLLFFFWAFPFFPNWKTPPARISPSPVFFPTTLPPQRVSFLGPFSHARDFPYAGVPRTCCPLRRRKNRSLKQLPSRPIRLWIFYCQQAILFAYVLAEDLLCVLWAPFHPRDKWFAILFVCESPFFFRPATLAGLFSILCRDARRPPLACFWGYTNAITSLGDMDPPLFGLLLGNVPFSSVPLVFQSPE